MTAELLFIDTFSVFFRAYYALPPMSTRAGEPTSALYGFSVLLLKLLKENPGAALAFALDAPEPTFRHEAFDAYKADRAAAPAPLVSQLGRLDDLLGALAPVPAFRVRGFEADDILATLAREAREAGRAALVVSGDRDLLQVARGSVRVSFLGARGKTPVTYDEAAVFARFGVLPERLPSYVALVGDPSDGLPRVPGVGPNTARRLLDGVADCRELFERLTLLTGDSDLAKRDERGGVPERVRRTLLAHRDQILHSEHLARLRDDVPLGAAGAAHSRPPTPTSLAALGERFEALEFRSLKARLDALRGTFAAPGT